MGFVSGISSSAAQPKVLRGKGDAVAPAAWVPPPSPSSKLQALLPKYLHPCQALRLLPLGGGGELSQTWTTTPCNVCVASAPGARDLGHCKSLALWGTCVNWCRGLQSLPWGNS